MSSIAQDIFPGRSKPGGRRILLSLAFVLSGCLSVQGIPGQAAASQGKKTAPSGTLLIPISPKIDSSLPTAAPVRAKSPAGQMSPPQPSLKASPAGIRETPSRADVTTSDTNDDKPRSRYSSLTENETELKELPSTISAEQGNIDESLPGSEVGEDTTLKGTIQLVADDTEYDQEKNTFLGTGNAVVILAGQNSKLEADTILYDQNNQTIDARGNVHIYRDGQLTTGSAFKFNVTSDEYLITNPDTQVNGTTVIARRGLGRKDSLQFRDGTLELPQPLHLGQQLQIGPLTSAELGLDKKQNPAAYLPSKPSYKFKARKMVYERYKDQGNLTVFGGKIMSGSFGFPLPKFTMTVGQENNRVVFPVTPMITNNMQMGGTSIGPSFNFAEGKTGVFSVAPLLQIGGRNPYDGTNSSGKLGAGARISFNNNRISSNLAYGSASNLMVADFKYLFARNLKLQSGANAFIEDGLFGQRRAKLLAEVVHTKTLQNVPLLSGLSFRTSAGWAQDNSALLNINQNYKELFTPTKPGNIAAMKFQEQITATTHPVFAVGDDKYGAKLHFFGGVALRGYSTGDSMIMGQLGPVLTVRMNRLNLQGQYLQSGVRGQTPFSYDQFVMGQRSVMVSGDYKVSKYLTVGASTGYNLIDKLSYQRTLTAAIGPEDFKVLLSRDFIRGINRYGFDVLFGQPIPFSKLVLKGGPDQGQFGGI